MSDTTKEVPTTTEASDAPNQNEVSTQETQPASEPSTAPAHDDDKISKQKFEELVAKARREEKEKLYQRIEKSKSDVEAAEAQKEAAQKELAEMKDRLKAEEEAKMSKNTEVEEAIKALREQNEALQRRLDEVAQEAESKVKQSELKSYRKERLEKEGLMLSELVDGASQEEIDEAIKVVKAREEAIRKAVEEQVRAEMKRDLPRPVAVDADSSSIAPAKDRYSISKLKDADYQSMRQQLMNKALESIRR